MLVRTFLSFSLEVELEVVLPWRKRAVAGSGVGEPAMDVDRPDRR